MTSAVPAIDAGWKELSGNLDEQREANIAVAKIMSGSMLDMETPEGLAVARKFLEDLAAGGAAPEIEPELRTVNGVPVRIFVPEIQKIRGVYLHIHGGGWAVGTASMNDASNAEIAKKLGVAAVSVDYRLAPEHPYPAGPDDCEAAARWLVEQLRVGVRDEHSADRRRVSRWRIVGGHPVACPRPDRCDRAICRCEPRLRRLRPRRYPEHPELRR